MRTQAIVAVIVLAVLAGLPGCTTSRAYVGQMSHDAAKSALEGAAEGVGSVPGPLRQALRQTLLGDDTLPQVSHRIAEATVQGVRAGLSARETQQYIDELVTRTVTQLGRDGGDATRQLIRATEPELSEALRRAIANVGLAVADDLDRDLAPRTRAMAKATADVLVATLATGLEVQLEHIRETARNIGRELISEAAISMRDRKDFVGEVTHVAMLQGMRGAIEGVRETLPGAIPDRLIIALVVLAVMVVASGGGLALYWWRYQQSAKSLTIVAQQINDFESSELKQAIRESAHANYVGPWLSSFLKRRGL